MLVKLCESDLVALGIVIVGIVVIYLTTRKSAPASTEGEGQGPMG